MAVLECNVVTCAHNDDGDKCYKDTIKVMGSEAKRGDCTCCGSYDNRGCGCSNVTGCADPKSDIACEALNCIYNDASICKATHVGVVGHNADGMEQTECATFRCR